MLLLLLVLYLLRMSTFWKWLVLLLFSSAQSVLFAALDVTYDTKTGFFNCGATFCMVLVLLLLTGRHDDILDVHNPVIGAVCAYVIVAAASIALYFVFGRSVMSSKGFGLSLGFQFVVSLWLAFDTRYIYRVLAMNGDAMQGAINLYADMIAFVLMLLWLMSTLMSVLDGTNFGCDGDCNCCCDVGDSGFYGYYSCYGCYDCECDEDRNCSWCGGRERMKIYPRPISQDMRINHEMSRV